MSADRSLTRCGLYVESLTVGGFTGLRDWKQQTDDPFIDAKYHKKVEKKYRKSSNCTLKGLL